MRCFGIFDGYFRQLSRQAYELALKNAAVAEQVRPDEESRSAAV